MKQNKKQVFITLIFILLISLLQACVSWTQIDVLQAGYINLPDNMDTIAILNRINPSNAYTNIISDSSAQSNSYIYHNDYTDIEIGDKRSFLVKCSDNCIDGLYNRLEKSYRFEVILIRDTTNKYVFDPLYYNDTILFPPVLTPLIVKQLCSDYNAQGLLVLEGLYIHSLGHTRMYKKKHGGNTPDSYLGADLIFSYSASFRLYQRKDGAVLDVMKIDTSKTFSIDRVPSVIALNNLLAKNDFIPGMMTIIDVAYSRRLIPFKKYVYRCYFTNFNKYMSAGSKYIRQQNWIAARESWERVYNESKPFQRAQAAYNLALTYEKIELDLYKARKLASESLVLFKDCNKINDSRIASAYLDSLNNRINALPKLNEQLGK
jgi:hypothetical protein